MGLEDKPCSACKHFTKENGMCNQGYWIGTILKVNYHPPPRDGNYLCGEEGKWFEPIEEPPHD